MNYNPLFRVRSWNNGARCMSFYILNFLDQSHTVCAGDQFYRAHWNKFKCVTYQVKVRIFLRYIASDKSKTSGVQLNVYDDVIKWKHFPRYWPLVRGIHRSPMNSPHKGQWRGALMFSLICAPINAWVNNHETNDLRRYRAHYDVTVLYYWIQLPQIHRLH